MQINPSVEEAVAWIKHGANKSGIFEIKVSYCSRLPSCVCVCVCARARVDVFEIKVSYCSRPPGRETSRLAAA